MLGVKLFASRGDVPFNLGTLTFMGYLSEWTKIRPAGFPHRPPESNSFPIQTLVQDTMVMIRTDSAEPLDFDGFFGGNKGSIGVNVQNITFVGPHLNRVDHFFGRLFILLGFVTWLAAHVVLFPSNWGWILCVPSKPLLLAGLGLRNVWVGVETQPSSA